MAGEIEISKVSISKLRNTNVQNDIKHLDQAQKEIYVLKWQIEVMNESFDSLSERIANLEQYNRALEVLVNRAFDRLDDNEELIEALRARVAPELNSFSREVDAALTKKRPPPKEES